MLMWRRLRPGPIGWVSGKGFNMEPWATLNSADCVPAEGASRFMLDDCIPVRERLWSELAPKTQYEALLAKNIIELELSYLTSRERVEGILSAAARDIVWKTLVRLMTDVPLQEAEPIARTVATAFVLRESAADDMLRRHNLTRGDIEAQAYRDNWTLLREIDQIQHRFEIRRAALMADYRAAQANARPRGLTCVDEAEET